MNKIFSRLLFFTFFLLIGSGCAPKQSILTRSRLLMGHVPVNISVKFAAGQKEKALQATEAAYARALELENRLSEWQLGSEISCLNRLAGRGDCALGSDSMALLLMAKELAQKTGFAFDIRFASPTPAARAGAIQIDGKQHQARLTHSQTRIGVSSIAKGFIVDQMIELFQNLGFYDVIIDAGGDTFASGGPWKVAFQKPISDSLEFILPQQVRNTALGSSGLYEQGRHIVDPRTGEKVERLGSVTVLADRLALASGLATGLFVLGEKQSLKVLAEFPGIQVYWIDPNGAYRRYEGPAKAKTP